MSENKVTAAMRLIMDRKGSYQAVFNGPKAEEVLEDLAKFCRAEESTFHPDARVAANLDGRREVWLRIQQHLNLSNEVLFELYGSTKK